MADPPLRVLILAGGVGSRFWPVSTPGRPKQLLALGSDQPLIADTVRRAVALAGMDRLWVLTGSEVGRAIQAATDLPDSALLVEPEAKGTAPVIAWAAWNAWREDPDTVLVSLHADHVIDPEDAFIDLLRDSVRLVAEHDLLLTVAVEPTRAEPGYGHIAPGDAIATSGSAVCLHVDAFVEKPDRATAEDYVARGYLWNSGIFLWRAGRFLEEVRAHAPEIGGALTHLERGDVSAFFSACPNVSVDEAVLERSDRVATVRATFRWDDVGAWEALTRTRPADEHGNVAVGTVHVVDGRDNVVYSERGPVVLFGVDDLVVVRTDAVTMVTSRERSPGLKKLLERLPDDLRQAEDP